MPVEGGVAPCARSPTGATGTGRGSADDTGGGEERITKAPLLGRLAAGYAFIAWLMVAVLIFAPIDKICPRSLYFIAPVVVTSPVITQLGWLKFLKVLFERATVLDTEVIKNLCQRHIFNAINDYGHSNHISLPPCYT